MKRILISICLALVLISCPKSPNTITVSKYKPVLIAKSSLVNSVFAQAASNLSNPGNYLVNSNYLYIVEKYKGVHIFNNTDPKNPQNIAFITVPGIETISIKNNTLYVDNSIDIVALDISNPVNPTLISRISGALPQPGPPDGLPLDAPVSQSTWPPNTVVVNWTSIRVN